jgi:hypothetical protein
MTRRQRWIDSFFPRRSASLFLLTALAIFSIGSATQTIAQSATASLKTLQQMEPGDAKIEQAVAAAEELQKLPSGKLVEVLRAMDESTPLGRNWLSGIASKLYAGNLEQHEPTLQSFLRETQHAGEARALVFDWLTQSRPDLRTRLLEGMMEDPSPELRYASIAQALGKLGEKPADLNEEGNKQRRLLLEPLLASARHPDQVNSLLKLLKEVGVELSPAKHFGFLQQWQVIGPFDNVGQKAFEVAYPVEADLLKGLYNPQQKYAGKKGDAAWQEATGNEEEGAVDLNPIYANEKGAIVYARAEFVALEPLDCQVRLGCINANKVWVNGQLVLSNEVYHASAQIDQYIGDTSLKAGKNVIVVKVCQNEQTEPWAQDWAFQLRLCDATGKAIAAKAD